MNTQTICNPTTATQWLITGVVALIVVSGAIAIFFATLAAPAFFADILSDDSTNISAPAQSDDDDNIIDNYGPSAFAAVNNLMSRTSDTQSATARQLTALDNTAWGSNAKQAVGR